jgi:hypothetical protein
MCECGASDTLADTKPTPSTATKAGSGFAAQHARLRSPGRISETGGMKKDETMRDMHRPIHSGFESLRYGRDPWRRQAQFARAFPANEQMTALGHASMHRFLALFEQGRSR